VIYTGLKIIILPQNQFEADYSIPIGEMISILYDFLFIDGIVLKEIPYFYFVKSLKFK